VDDDRGAWLLLLTRSGVLAAVAVGGFGRAVAAVAVVVVVGKRNDVRPQHVGFLELFHH
jgi:ABC-type tungstate transport system substrate-binding protein